MRARYPSIAATLALLIALSTGAYAVNLARGSVAAKHLKKNAVTKPKIARGAVAAPKLAKNAVNSAKVKNGSLKAADFAPGTLLAGAAGLDGDDGDDGLDGAPGLAGLEYVRQPFNGLTPGATGSFTAGCPAGKVPVAGGYDVNQAVYMRGERAVSATGSTLTPYDAWRVSLQNVSINGQDASGYVYALCATVQDGFPNPGWAP